MYLFTRSARLAPGNIETSMDWAVRITEKVNQIVELEVGLWARVFSPGSGTLVWSTTVESLAALEASEDKLMADSGYLSLVEQGAKLGSSDPIDDQLTQLVYADPGAADVQAQYATVVEARLAPGSSVRGVELGIDIAQQASRITGCPTSFGLAVTGDYGGVAWLTMLTSVEQLQHSQEAIAGAPEFAKKVDEEASTVFLPNVQQMTYRRIC
ncbi:MAG TPA: hypothetical protein VNG12_07770 [Acidimicrobiales bacterium]|nr:hypothetical protein [Acidimicrobiales bacterium]